MATQPAQVVRVRSHFDGLPPKDIQLVRLKFAVAAGPWIPNGWLVIGNYTTPEKQVFDISGLFFTVDYQLAPGIGVRLPDDAAAGRAYLRVQVNSQPPWQVEQISATGREGFDVLNTNILDLWGDTPGHLIIHPASRIDLDVILPGGWMVPPNAQVTATLIGRRISLSLYERLQAMENVW
jgi:hypothetical protein